MNKKKQTLRENFIEALQSYKKNDFKNAEIFCYKILSINAYHFDTIFLLATIFAARRDYIKAKEFILQAVDIQPKNKSALNNLGTTYKELGEFKEAIKTFEKVLDIDPDHTNANYNLGLVFYNLRDLKTSKSYLKKTVTIQKNYAAAFISLGNVHVDLKEYNEAVSSYKSAIEINPNIVSAHNNLGLVYRDLNDYKNAINCYQKAIEIKFDYASSHHNLGLAYKELGEFEKSIKSHELAIKYEPENLMNYHFLSEIKKNILDGNLKTKIEKIISGKKVSLANLAYGNYLLAKYARREKSYKKEFNFLIEGHKNFYSSNKKKFDLGIKYCFDDVHQIIAGGKVEKTIGRINNKIKPIFIIGVPRCGSTLLERIIVSGEKNIPIGEETGVIGHFIPSKVLKKQSLNLGTDEDIRNELFNIYKNKGLISEKYGYTFTDKSLDNFFYLELIRNIFPNAKIINCKREVISSIMSIFQNNLTTLAWTHNLENIFKYFNNYFEIIENYKKVNPGEIYELDFEKLVNNPEEESKKLMKFCELPWDKKCLEFYKRKDLFSKTASNIQIREAIYKQSSKKYLPYKEFLMDYGKKYSWFK